MRAIGGVQAAAPKRDVQSGMVGISLVRPTFRIAFALSTAAS
jgi:hypothetical protein